MLLLSISSSATATAAAPSPACFSSTEMQAATATAAACLSFEGISRPGTTTTVALAMQHVRGCARRAVSGEMVKSNEFVSPQGGGWRGACRTSF